MNELVKIVAVAKSLKDGLEEVLFEKIAEPIFKENKYFFNLCTNKVLIGYKETESEMRTEVMIKLKELFDYNKHFDPQIVEYRKCFDAVIGTSIDKTVIWKSQYYSSNVLLSYDKTKIIENGSWIS